MSTKYKLSHIWSNWEAEVQIDGQKAEPAIKEMVDFWFGSEERLALHDGNYIETFLEQLAREIYYVQAEHHVRKVESVIQQFNSREGWAKMDGSQGIKILSVDEVDFDYSDFCFEEL